MRKWLVIIILIELAFTGCGVLRQKTIVEELKDAAAAITLDQPIAKDSIDMSLIESHVEAAKIDTVRNADDTLAMIVIPASTTTTTLYVSKPHKSWKDKLLPMKNNKVKNIEVLGNKKVTVIVPEIVPWWYFALGFLISAAALYILINKYIGLCAKPIEWITKVFAWMR